MNKYVSQTCDDGKSDERKNSRGTLDGFNNMIEEIK